MRYNSSREIPQEGDMFLKKSKKKYKDKGYDHYSLTESYRESGKVKQRHIAKLGALTPEQAERIRLVNKFLV